MIKSRENFGMNYYRDFVRKTLVGYTYSIVLFLFLMMIIVFVANIMWFSVGKNQNNNKKITKILNEQINAYKEGIQELVTDDTILDVFRYPDKEHITSANRVLYSFVNGQEIRSSFCLAECNGNVVCSNLFLDNQQIFMNNTMVKYVEGKLQDNPKEVYLLPSDLGYQYKQTGDFIIASGIVDQGELVGYLFFDVYDDAIYQTVKSFPLDDIVITDRYDTILFSLRRTYSDPLEKFPSQKFQIASDSKYIKIDGIHYQVSVNRVDDDSLIIYTLISLEFQRKMMPVCLLFLLLFGGFIGIILHPLNSRITNKNLEAIEELRKSIEEMGNGNMDYELQTQVFSEFKELNEAYRNVIIQREELLQHNSELTERKRIMEIKQLEEQFNPHFIFNVLETLRYEILIDSAKASDMVVAFANLMRYSINYGNEQVSLETDIEYINDYLLLQKMRYNRRLTYNISIPCELMDCKIPKLVLQPVVENSLSHGMKHVDSIFIQIEAREEEGKLKLIVQDNGCGIDREHLEKLRKSLDEEDALREHIGMYNSHRVVKLIYGSQYGLDIESEPGEGTTVSITMPMEMEL